MVKSKSARLVWERLGEVRTSGKLDYEGIVRAAMDVADRKGLPAVSMRTVAEALGSGVMSLYRYVASKEELLDLILDAAYGEICIPAKHAGDFQKDLARVARATRSALKQHPWLGALVTMRPTLGPNYLRWFEFLLGATNAPGRDLLTQMRMIGTLGSYVAGFVSYELGEMETNRRHKLTEEQRRELAAPYMERVLATGQFPNLARFMESGTAEPDDAGFEFGLRAVLDGLSGPKR